VVGSKSVKTIFWQRRNSRFFVKKPNLFFDFSSKPYTTRRNQTYILVLQAEELLGGAKIAEKRGAENCPFLVRKNRTCNLKFRPNYSSAGKSEGIPGTSRQRRSWWCSE
jgi:hypothetical protein